MTAFKENFNQELIEWIAYHFNKQSQLFDKNKFIEISNNDLASLELKERAAQITQALTLCLPDDFYEASELVHASLHPSQDSDRDGADIKDGLTGWAIWPLCDWAAEQGIDQPDIALNLLKCLTKRFSSEFAIRPFLAKRPSATLRVMNKWARHKNRHVRRLASEGSRPRLPWGMQLKSFVIDPSPILPLLRLLRDDEEGYVRRSVANSLNDIAKDHPDMVAAIAENWLRDASPDRKKLIKHACRTLIKQGHKPTLKAFGYKAVKGLEAEVYIESPEVIYGEALEFTCDFRHKGSQDQPVIIDYAIHFVKASGKTAPKVFKWKSGALKAGASSASKRHVIKPITTRKYYAGEHRLEIIINGVTIASKAFELVI